MVNAVAARVLGDARGPGNGEQIMRFVRVAMLAAVLASTALEAYFQTDLYHNVPLCLTT